MAFKDLFIKSEETEEKIEQTPQQPKQEEVVVKQTPTISNSQPKSINANEMIVSKIWDKIIAANRPGPDYLELKNNVEALEDLQISPEQKLATAFKILKKSYPNFEKNDIIKAIDFYINIVNEEKNSGLKELDLLISENVTGVENEIKTMQERSEELKRQYEELQTQIGEKTIELTKTKTDLDAKHNAFISSIEAVMNVLVGDKNQINSINF